MAMPAAFASLESPNYRRYWSGQLWGVTARGVLIATLGWLVIRKLNAGGTLLGLASGALYAPGLLLGPWSGLLGDRAARRRRMMSLGQLVQAAGVLWIAALTALDLLRPWQLVVLALLIGLGETIEIGSRQPFIGELVNDAQLPNALALNGALYSLGRLAGPGLAAALLPVLGASPCLVLAGVGHLMVVVVLRTINLETLHTRSRATRRPGQIRETLSLVVRRPELRWTLLPLAAVGALAFEFPVVYPLLADEVDDTGAAIGLFLAVLGAGALFGALVAAQLPSATSERMAVAFTGLGLSMAASAVLRDILALLVCVSVAGACSIVANSAAHARLQLATPPEQRGRISSLYALAKDGSTALGAPLIGAIAAATNVRVAIAVGALTALVGANAVLVGRTRRFSRERLRALPQMEGHIVKQVPEVLFVCVHNAGRSQMAAALLDHRAEGRVHVRSAGSDPADRLNPAVVEAMSEVGLDVSKEFPKPLTDEVVRAADVVITMGCGDACPVYLGKRYLNWELDDPAGKSVEEVRVIRDEIDARVQTLLAEMAGADIG